MPLPYTFLFVFFLSVRTIWALSSAHWLIFWVMLEINLISFIPLILANSKFIESESAIKYFLVQAIGSGLLISSIFLSYTIQRPITAQIIPYIILLRLILKLGIAPLHFWFPPVIAGISWISATLLTTWQKLTPFLAILFIIGPFIILIIIPALVRSLVGGWGGINQSQLRPLIAYSSIGHLGWISAGALYSLPTARIYLMIYIIIVVPFFFILNKLKIHTTKHLTRVKSPEIAILISLLLISIAGLPPLIGFTPKILILFTLLEKINLMILIPLITGTVINIYYYFSIILTLTLLTLNNGGITQKIKKIFIITPPLIVSIFLLSLSFITLYALTLLHKPQRHWNFIFHFRYLIRPSWNIYKTSYSGWTRTIWSPIR